MKKSFIIIIIFAVAVFLTISIFIVLDKSDSNLTNSNKNVVDCGEILLSELVEKNLELLMSNNSKLRQKYECFSENIYHCNSSILKIPYGPAFLPGPYYASIGEKTQNGCNVTLKSENNVSIKCDLKLGIFNSNEIPPNHWAWSYGIISQMFEKLMYEEKEIEYFNPETNEIESFQCEVRGI